MKNDLFYFYWRNPFKTLWKVRHIFKMPKLSVNFYKAGWFSYAKILYIVVRDVDWKINNDSISYQCPPKINIVLFGKFGIYITFCYPIEYDSCIWKTILDYLYYNKPIDISIKNNAYIKSDGVGIYDATDFMK